MSVLLETSLGDVVIDLFWEKAPLACKNFIKLCLIKYYNGALFFDVQKDYLTRIMHEKKEPTSLNRILYGEQAKYFEDEIDPEAKHNRFGTVSTANVGPNMNDSNFFFTLSHDNIESLNGKHTIFGVVAEGAEVLEKINVAYVDSTNRPFKNIRILHTAVLDDPFEDPEGLEIPETSPEINFGDTDRLDVNDQIEIGQGRTEEEIIEETKKHEVKAKAIVLEMIGDLPDAEIKPPENVLFVCKLNPVTQEDDLETIFSQFGPIKSCEVIRDWKTGGSLQYAFIEFETQAACEEAFLKMENALIDERRIHVDFSQSVAKYWYKYKRGNPIPLGGAKEEGDGAKKHRPGGGPRLELKSRHAMNKGNYGIVIEEDEAKHKTRRKEQNGPPKEEKSKKEKPPRQRSKSKSKSRNRSDSRERRKNKRPQEERKEEKSRGKREKSRSRSPRRDKYGSTKGRDNPREREDKKRDHERRKSRERKNERERSRGRDNKHKKDDRKKKKASSSRSSSSSSSSSRSSRSSS